MTLDQFTWWLQGYLTNAGVPAEVKQTIEAKLAECRTPPLNTGITIRGPMIAHDLLARGPNVSMLADAIAHNTLATGGPVPEGTPYVVGDSDQRGALTPRQLDGQRFGGGLT